MSCDARQVMVDGSQFAGLTVESLKAVQLQLVADTLLILTPGTDMSYEAVIQRAIASGVYNLTKRQLQGITLQLLCDMKEGL